MGDKGYPLEPWLLTPLSNPQGQQERRYNKLHAKSRNVVERSFGVLKGRFRCLLRHRTLHYSDKKAANIVYSCVILHNMLMKAGAVVESIEEEELEVLRKQ